MHSIPAGFKLEFKNYLSGSYICIDMRPDPGKPPATLSEASHPYIAKLQELTYPVINSSVGRIRRQQTINSGKTRGHFNNWNISVQKLLILLLPAFYTATVSAQTISGKVIDAGIGTTLQFAHIAIPETGEGTLTDEHGSFKLIVKDTAKAKTLRASFVGYQTITKSIVGKNGYLLLALTPDVTYLKEIVITPIDPVKLIKESLLKISQNHGGHRLLTCFYRLTAKKLDNFIHVSEASFEINQQPEEYNQIKVLKAREIADERAFNGVGMGFGTKISAVKSMDLTLEQGDSFLSPAGLKKHEFVYEGITTRAGIEVHEISFDQRKKIREGLSRGKLYLSTATLAFIEIEYELSPRGIQYVQVGNVAERAALKLLNIDIEVLRQRTVITYRSFDNKWYLDHVSRDETVRVKSKRYNFDVTADERIDFLITSIDTTYRKPFVKDETDFHGSLESSADTAKHFWNDYNIIPSHVNYDQVASAIEARNGYTLLKKEVKEKLSKYPKTPAARTDSVLTYYHNKGFFNGTALIKHKGKIILNKGYGYSDKEAKTRNDTTTIFRIGSLSKSFTSYLIWTLKQEGLIQYDDSVQKFIPWYPHHGITIEHLLTHSSGIPNYTNAAQFIDSIRHRYSIEELIRNFGMEKPLFPPGTYFSYSNTGYVLLALIAEKASGRSFNELITEKITKPFDLHYTALAPEASPLLAKGYLYGVEEPEYAVSNVVGAGALASNTIDLLRWDKAQYNPALAELFKARTYYKDWGAHYGYGWMIDQYQFWASKRHMIIYHPGTDFGFKSIMARQPDQENLIVLLNNTGEFPLFDITDLLFTILN